MCFQWGSFCRCFICESDRNKFPLHSLLCLPNSSLCLLTFTAALSIWLAASFSFVASLLIWFSISLCLVFFFHFFSWIPLLCSPWELFYPLLNPYFLLCEWVSVSEPGTLRNSATGQNRIIATLPPASPSIPLLLFTGIYAVSIDVNEGHRVADYEPNTLLVLLSNSNTRALLFFFCLSYVYSCVDKQHWPLLQ